MGRELEGTGIERGQAEAIAKAVQSAAGAGHEGLVKRADLDSAVAVVAAHRFLVRSEAGLRLTLTQTNSAAGLGAAPKPAAGVFTRGPRAIAAFRRFRPRTGR